jgi:hypothetical protein
MKTQLVKLSKTAGWIAFALGVIHLCVTIMIVKNTVALEAQWRGTFLFMYVAAGLGCLLAGSAMLLSTAKQIRNFMPSNHIFLISAIFMLLLGIGAPVAMSNNPFGYISLAVGVFAMAVALLRYRQII